MWNPVKITKALYHLLTTYGEIQTQKGYTEDLKGDPRLDHVLVLYRELNFPFGWVSMTKLRNSRAGRDMVWGRGYNEFNHVNDVVLPKLTDHEYLATLAPNTVGAHYYHLVKQWGLEDLYNQRFKPEEMRPDDSLYHSFSDDIRANHSRHVIISHDLWHAIFRYDTSPIGEGMIQSISAHQTYFWPMHIIGWGVTFKEILRTKSFAPWKVWMEGLRIAKAASKDLLLQSPLDLLEMDIEECREKFNIGEARVFAEYVKNRPDDFRMDTIHPEYRDKVFQEAIEI